MKSLLCFLFFLTVFLCTGQNKKLDSLQTAYKNEITDTTKVNLLNKIALEYYTSFEFDKAIEFLNKALPLAKKINFKKAEAYSYNILGAIEYYKGNNKAAIDIYKKSLQLRDELGDKRGVAAIYGNICGVFTNTGDYSEALNYANLALKINSEIKDTNGLAVTHNRIGEIYRSLGNYPEAIRHYLMALKKAEEVNKMPLVGQIYNNIGILYGTQNNNDEALKYYLKSADIEMKYGSRKGMSGKYHNIGTIYFKRKDYAEAIKNFTLALQINTEIGNKYWMGNNLTGIASIYGETGHKEKALETLEKALEIRKEIGDKAGMAEAYSSMSGVKLELKQYGAARKDLNEALNLAKEVHALKELASIYKTLTSLDSTENNFKEAFNNHKLYVIIRDSLINEENSKKILQSQMQYDFDKKETAIKLEQERKDVVAREETKKKNLVIAGVSVVLLLVLIFAVFVYRSYLQKQKANVLITEQKKLVEEKQKEILDSINYAKRLQEAILPPLHFIQRHLPLSFVLYSPKDIVAGDFYWMEVVQNKGPEASQILIAAADSTGHGVPGALVSVVCSTALSRAVKEFGITDPGEILDKTRELVLETFSKSDKDVKDGMDISLVSISITPHSNTTTVSWAGANNPLWYISNGEMQSITANKQPIGKAENQKPFTTHNLELNKGDSIYLFTDGYADQFGGPKGKKFKYKTLQELLKKGSQLDPEQQRKNLYKAFCDWKNDMEQVDDVCIIGIKL